MRALVRAPAFVHIGLATGAAAVVLTVVLAPARFALRELALPGLSFWGGLAAATAGVLAILVYTCCVYAGCGRPDAGGTRATSAIVRRAGRSAVVRFVAMQFIFIAGLLLLACSAIALFRNTAPGVFVAALTTGCAGVLWVALWFLDRSRFAALVDLADGFPLPAGWRAVRVAHVHQQRVKAALAWDAATARREQRPSLASRLVPAGHAAVAPAAPSQRGRLSDPRFSLHKALTGEARLRLRGLLPIVALAVPYGAAAAIAAAVLAPPPSGPLPMSVSDAAAARPGDRPVPQSGASGGGRGAGGQVGAGREARAEGTGGNAGVGGQPAAGGGQHLSGAGGEPRPAGAGPAGGGASAAGRNGVNGADGGNPSAAGAGDQQASGTSRGATGGGGEQGAGGTRGAAAGSGVLPAADSRAVAQGAGSGRGPRSAPKPFVEGRQAYGHTDGGEIVVTRIETTGNGTSGPSVPDSAVSRGIRLSPAPLIDWSSPSVSRQDGADIPRVYRPRQALPAWTAPLIPGAAPGRP